MIVENHIDSSHFTLSFIVTYQKENTHTCTHTRACTWTCAYDPTLHFVGRMIPNTILNFVVTPSRNVRYYSWNSKQYLYYSSVTFYPSTIDSLIHLHCTKCKIFLLRSVRRLTWCSLFSPRLSIQGLIMYQVPSLLQTYLLSYSSLDSVPYKSFIQVNSQQLLSVVKDLKNTPNLF